jgi:very-short-patch-repair endonuclease
MTAAAIDSWVKRRLLHPVFRGVYLVGHRVAPAGAWEMAAVLATGDGAVVSHSSAAHLWALLPYPAQPRPIHITVHGRQPSQRPGIRLHRVRSLHRRDVRTFERIPITTPARTILDLAGSEPHRVFERALAEAYARRLVTDGHLEAVLDRNAHRPGAAVLRAVLASEAGPAWTRSEAEERFLSLIKTAGLPTPETNIRIAGHEVDFLWREHRLVVEVDGYAFHSSRAAFERDRLRDAELQANGLRVIRITWRQIADHPGEMLGRLLGALDSRSRIDLGSA